MQQNNVFAQLPDHVVIAAVAEADGQYSVYAKLNEQGDHATLGRRLNASKALALVDHLKVYLELPDEAAYMEGRDDIPFCTYAAGVRLYMALVEGGAA